MRQGCRSLKRQAHLTVSAAASEMREGKVGDGDGCGMSMRIMAAL